MPNRRQTQREKIIKKAIEILKNNPQGVRYVERKNNQKSNRDFKK